MSKYIEQAISILEGKVKPKKQVKKSNVQFESSTIRNCPKCSKHLSKVSLYGGNEALYCPQHRIAVPVPV